MTPGTAARKVHYDQQGTQKDYDDRKDFRRAWHAGSFPGGRANGIIIVSPVSLPVSAAAATNAMPQAMALTPTDG